jgi:hypothetical protein
MSIVPNEVAEYHRSQCADARAIYIATLSPIESANDWHTANIKGRKQIVQMLRDTRCLRDIEGGLQKRAAHMFILRALFAPPISQDQLELLCSDYSKGAEKRAGGMSKRSAKAVAATFMQWRDQRLTRWLDRNSNPSRRELDKVISTLAPLTSSQIVSTMRRGRASQRQEQEVMAFLETNGWIKANRLLLQTPADLEARHFMHKALCKTTAVSPGEVDIACGVTSNLILAMECKVTNDATNSIKRTDDVLKKHNAWRPAWGVRFIETAAMMQGVISYKSIEKLLSNDVHVFWSHDLDALGRWLDQKGQTA